MDVTNKDLIRDKIKELINLSSKKKEWIAGQDLVQYAGSFFDGSETLAAIECLLGGWLGLGELGIRFENKFAPLLGKEYGVLTNSGSSANLLMISALKSKNLWNLPQGIKIITPAAGFPTTLNPIIQCGFEPVFVDIELDTLNLNLDQLEEVAKTSGAKVLIFAHVLGNPPDMKRVMDIVQKYDLILLEDCCDALGSTYNNVPLGSFGSLASCSFYPAHHITIGEGGFVACNLKEQEVVVKSLREWGRSCYCAGKAASCLKNGTCKKRFSPWIPDLPDEVFDHKYVYSEIGYNIKPMELQAAMGLEQLKKLDLITQKRKYNHKRLTDIFLKYKKYFYFHNATENSDPSWFAFPLTLKPNVPFKRTDLSMFFETNKIQTRNYFAGNILLQPGYNHFEFAKGAKEKYPVSSYVMKNTFFLGTSPVITDQQINYIELILEKFIRTIE